MVLGELHDVVIRIAFEVVLDVVYFMRLTNNFDTGRFIRYIATGIIAGDKTTVGTKGNEF